MDPVRLLGGELDGCHGSADGGVGSAVLTHHQGELVLGLDLLLQGARVLTEYLLSTL